MKNKYYYNIFDNLFKSMIEDEKANNYDIDLVRYMLDDLLYKKNLSKYTIELMKKRVNEN